MAWRIDLSEDARKELSRLDRPAARRIHAFPAERLAPLDDPCGIGEPLRGPKLGSYWKYRAGDWLIIAAIEDDALRILVLRIGNRREVYR